MFFPLLILFVLDLYAFQAFRTVTHRRWVMLVYWGLAASIYITFITGVLTDFRSWAAPLRTYIFGFVFIIYLFKLIVSSFMVIDDVVRLVRYIAGLITYAGEGNQFTGVRISRSEFLAKIGLFVGSIPLTVLTYGILRNRYNYDLKHVTLLIPNLPAAFEGFKITQISDIHTGSFTSPKPLQKAIDLINGTKADVIFFTGDLVNFKADEADEYIPVFKQVTAKHGVFSITGNHDYGDYVDWENAQAKQANFEQFKEQHRLLGWDLLINEHRFIEKDGSKMAVIGVENWSAVGRFPTYGKLDQAYAGCEGSDLKLLLSHDPSHWRAQVLGKYPDIAATFSGHTHGFQLGINVPGLKWSSAQYMYKEWIGLYQEAGQQLYVNAGLGFTGYPGRVGFLPEITAFELRKA